MRDPLNPPSYDLHNQDASPHAPNLWIDIWWPVFVIGYGALFVALICACHPTT